MTMQRVALRVRALQTHLRDGVSRVLREPPGNLQRFDPTQKTMATPISGLPTIRTAAAFRFRAAPESCVGPKMWPYG